MNQGPKPTTREARVVRCCTAGNAYLNKNPSPEAAQGAGFGGVGSSKLENRYLAELGTTTRCAGRRHKPYPKQVYFDFASFCRNKLQEPAEREIAITQIGTQIPGSGDGNWSPEPPAGGEILVAAFAENFGNSDESATGSLAIDCGILGFPAFLRQTKTNKATASAIANTAAGTNTAADAIAKTATANKNSNKNMSSSPRPSNTAASMKLLLIGLLFIALAINSSSLFSQWASSAWVSYGTMFVDTNAKNLMEDKI